VVLTTASRAAEEEQEQGFVCVLRLDPMTGRVVNTTAGSAAVESGVEEEEGLEGAFNLMYTSGSTGPPKGVRPFCDALYA
jgi:long-subunit acyl-CoA synthetase (AMP-forming)